MFLLDWYFFKYTLLLKYWFPSESFINAFLSFNFTILNVLFNQFVDNLFSLCMLFTNTTSPFSNSTSFARRFWSMYCWLLAFRFRSVFSVWFYCFLVSRNCGIPFLTWLLNNNVAGAALVVWCGDVLHNNKNLFNSCLQSLFSAWPHWLTFSKHLLNRSISPFAQGE